MISHWGVCCLVEALRRWVCLCHFVLTIRIYSAPLSISMPSRRASTISGSLSSKRFDGFEYWPNKCWESSVSCHESITIDRGSPDWRNAVHPAVRAVGALVPGRGSVVGMRVVRSPGHGQPAPSATGLLAVPAADSECFRDIAIRNKLRCPPRQRPTALPSGVSTCSSGPQSLPLPTAEPSRADYRARYAIGTDRTPGLRCRGTSAALGAADSGDSPTSAPLSGVGATGGGRPRWGRW